MARALYTNNATATLAGGISNSATTVTLNSGQGSLFPSPTGGNYFYGTLSDAATGTLLEIVKVTSRTSDTLVIARAQQGTVAQAYNANDKFELRVTKSGFDELASLTNAETIQNKTIDSTNSIDAAAVVGTVSSASSVAGTTSAKIQSLTASVAANDLTIQFNGGYLDFRNPSLSGGTPNTISVGTNSITVPSGATLGTRNGQQARLICVEYYNGGSPVMGIVNVSGGLVLDETNLVSPTIISASATSASTFYSASAVGSNSPYRIVGFLDITETTAGTWATAPSLVQGSGGQAMMAMSAIGYGQTWQDFSGSRVIGTTYYNTTGKPIAVSADITGSANAQCSAILTINGVAVVQAITSESNGTVFNGVGTPFFAIVPPGASYMISNNTYTNVITRWVELR